MSRSTLPPAVRAMFKPPFWVRTSDRTIHEMKHAHPIAVAIETREGFVRSVMPSMTTGSRWWVFFESLRGRSLDLDEICKRLNEAWETSA